MHLILFPLHVCFLCQLFSLSPFVCLSLFLIIIFYFFIPVIYPMYSYCLLFFLSFSDVHCLPKSVFYLTFYLFFYLYLSLASLSICLKCSLSCMLFVDVLPDVPCAFLLHGVGADGAKTQCPGMAGLCLYHIHSCRQDKGGEAKAECLIQATCLEKLETRSRSLIDDNVIRKRSIWENFTGM